MAIDRQAPPTPASAYSPPARAHRLTGGGTTGNERLTAATGFLLLGLLAAIGVTILRLGPLLSVHMFVGILLLGPVGLKLASTGYRFMRYYSANPRYRLKGPPPMLLRMLAPMVVLSTLVVFVTGVALLLIGPSSRDTLLPIHKISFFVWLGFTAVHVLGHLVELPEMLRADYGSSRLSSDVTGRAGRTLALSAALVLGAVLAILLLPDFGTWLHGSDIFHGNG